MSLIGRLFKKRSAPFGDVTKADQCVMERWARSSATVRDFVRLMGGSSGTRSLRGGNAIFFRGLLSSPAEGNIICFVALARVVDVMNKLNEAGQPGEALLRAANLLDGIPAYEEVGNGCRRFARDYSGDRQALLEFSRRQRSQFLTDNIPYHMRCAMTLRGRLT